MSEQTDDAQKTEEPPPKKLDDARQRGNVARSMEVDTLLMLFAGTLIIAFIAPGLMTEVRNVSTVFVERPDEFSLEFGNLVGLLVRAAAAVSSALMLPAVIMVIFAIVTGVIQNGIVFSPKALEPKLEKLSLIAGAKRMFSLRQVVEFVKGLIKILIVGMIAVLMLAPAFRGIGTTPTIDLSYMMGAFGCNVCRFDGLCPGGDVRDCRDGCDVSSCAASEKASNDTAGGKRRGQAGGRRPACQRTTASN